MDPYALGLLLGDGCLTTSDDPELYNGGSGAGRGARGRRSPASSCAARAMWTTSFATCEGHRGGVIVANPVTRRSARARPGRHAIERRSSSLTMYLYNSPRTSASGAAGPAGQRWRPVTQSGRTCRIQYTTCSERSRRRHLSRSSLGGVAYSRMRAGSWATPGIRRRSASAPPLGRVRLRYPPAERRSSRSGSSASAIRTGATALAGRCASSTTIEPAARRRRSASRSRRPIPCTSPRTSWSRTTDLMTPSSSSTRRRTPRPSR